MHRAGSAGFPVSTEQGSEHYTSCERDTSNLDLLLDLLLADWMPADAALNFPGAMAMDNARQLLYFCDTGNHKIKVLDISRNEVLTVAGIGASVSKFSGDGQPARDAVMATPAGLALDEENGHLYLSDHENHVIRRVKLGENRLTGIIESVAGTGVGGLAQDGLAPLLSRFNYPRGLALEKLSTGVRIYVADSRNHQVAVVDLTSPQMVRKIAGRLEAGVVPTEVGDKGPALEAQVYQPEAIAFANGELFFAEPRMDRLRQMDLSSGVIDTALSTYAVNFSAGEGLAGEVLKQAKASEPAEAPTTAASPVDSVPHMSEERHSVNMSKLGTIVQQQRKMKSTVRKMLKKFLADNGFHAEAFTRQDWGFLVNCKKSSFLGLKYTYPLHEAARQNAKKVVYWLLCFGADPTQTDSKKRTALDWIKGLETHGEVRRILELPRVSWQLLGFETFFAELQRNDPLVRG
ncbi:unnamed protein product [Effrenium voratum]|nr:unnamed protein product [Effrenium voratum]